MAEYFAAGRKHGRNLNKDFTLTLDFDNGGSGGSTTANPFYSPTLYLLRSFSMITSNGYT